MIEAKRRSRRSAPRRRAATAGLGLCLALAFGAGPSLSQVLPIVAGDTAALRAEQEQQFQEMFADPDNLDLMFRYALTSIRLNDYEAAITTLDRMLIYNSDLPRVKLELAAVYFRLGSYPVAEYYFRQVVEDEDADEALKVRAEEFLDVIGQRTQESYFTGLVGVQALFSTNANTGPDDRDFEFGGVIFQLTGEDVTAQTDVGVAVSAQVAHVYDLGGASGDIWRTDVVGYSQRFSSTSEGAADVIFGRTGPRLSLDDDRYGLKGRPFIEADHVRSDNDPYYTTIGAGVELSNSLDAGVTVFGDTRVGWREYHDDPAGFDQDGVDIRGSFGASLFVDDSLTLSGRSIYALELADAASERSYAFGGQLGFNYRYDSGYDFAGRDWRLAGSATAAYRMFDAPGPFDPGNKREDFDLALGLDHTAYLQNGLAVTLEADYFFRDSDISNFDFDVFTVAAGFEYAF